MSEENQPIDEELNPELSGSEIIEEEGNRITRVSGMYQDYFLDYASYVILERAVPALNDGLKPVQRRLLHAMKEMDDGRFHKVANIIGQTMRFHPHGDASIGDALVHGRSFWCIMNNRSLSLTVFEFLTLCGTHCFPFVVSRTSQLGAICGSPAA